MSEETVTILKSVYKRLLQDSHFLDALRSCGVDNWEGYSDACQMVEEDGE